MPEENKSVGICRLRGICELAEKEIHSPPGQTHVQISYTVNLHLLSSHPRTRATMFLLLTYMYHCMALPIIV